MTKTQIDWPCVWKEFHLWVKKEFPWDSFVLKYVALLKVQELVERQLDPPFWAADAETAIVEHLEVK